MKSKRSQLLVTDDFLLITPFNFPVFNRTSSDNNGNCVLFLRAITVIVLSFLTSLQRLKIMSLLINPNFTLFLICSIFTIYKYIKHHKSHRYLKLSITSKKTSYPRPLSSASYNNHPIIPEKLNDRLCPDIKKLRSNSMKLIKVIKTKDVIDGEYLTRSNSLNSMGSKNNNTKKFHRYTPSDYSLVSLSDEMEFDDNDGAKSNKYEDGKVVTKASCKQRSIFQENFEQSQPNFLKKPAKNTSSSKYPTLTPKMTRSTPSPPQTSSSGYSLNGNKPKSDVLRFKKLRSFYSFATSKLSLSTTMSFQTNVNSTLLTNLKPLKLVTRSVSSECGNIRE